MAQEGWIGVDGRLIDGTVTPPSARRGGRDRTSAIGVSLIAIDDVQEQKMSAYGVRVQPVSATPLVVYRLAFGSPRSFADVD